VGTSLVIVPRSGSEARSLSVDNAHSPAWSPDGRWIAFVRGNNDYGYTPTALGNIGAAAVMMVPAGGGEIIDLTGTAALNIGPVWLRDSRGLLFVSDRDGSRDVYRLSVDRNGEPGATTRLTTALDAHTIHLSADGSRLAYSEFRYGTNVWSLPIPEGPPASVADAVQLTRGDQVVEAMAVSPDGRWLTYDSSLSGNQDLFRMPIDGGEEEQLTTDPTPDFMTSYSPDGSEIAFFSMRTGERKVYTMPVNGGTPVQVTFGPGEHRYPTFSPDGLRLAYSISDVSTVPAGISVVTRAGPGQPGTNEMLLTEDGGNRPEGTVLAGRPTASRSPT